MKRIIVAFFSIFMLFFFASAVQAQNKSAEKGTAPSAENVSVQRVQSGPSARRASPDQRKGQNHFDRRILAGRAWRPTES